MLRNRISGFTLIELMVVIVIIGVLASLAIPKFTEASAKAKAVEAPRTIASYESAFLAAVAEVANPDSIKVGDLIYTNPTESKWWAYDFVASPAITTNPTKAAKTAVANVYSAAAIGPIGPIKKSPVGILGTKYVSSPTGAGNEACFDRAINTKVGVDDLKKMVPNFLPGCTDVTGAARTAFITQQ